MSTSSNALRRARARTPVRQPTRLQRLTRALCASSALALAIAGSAHAAETFLQAPPPANQSVDERGVDLVTGALTLSVQPLSIGQPGAGGLSWTRTFIGSGWRDSFVGTINSSGSTYTVSIGGASEAFTSSNGQFTAQKQSGSTLTYNAASGTYTYTTRDGAQALFDPGSAPGGGPWAANVARISQMVQPSGEITYFNYVTVPYTISSKPDATVYAERLYSLSTNVGYELDFQYEVNSGASTTDKSRLFYVKSVSAKNLSTGSQTAVVALSSSTASTRTITDAIQRVTEFTYDSSGRLTSFHNPQGSANGFTVVYDGLGRVQSLSNGIGTWTYAYADNGSQRTTTVTDLKGHTRTIVADLNASHVLSRADGLNHITSYGYDGAGRLTDMARPEGEKVHYDYDARGNVYQTTAIGKDGTSYVTQADFDQVCSYIKTCNKPNATRDAKSNQVNYTWDTNTGFVTSITSPAVPSPTNPNVNVRPQAVYSYNALTAIYSGGPAYGDSPAASPVTRLASIIQCATGPGCSPSSSDAVGTWITYDASNNLLPVSVQQGAGSNSPPRTTTGSSYDSAGNLYTTTDARGNVTRYRYDAAGQLLGVVSADPDGGGPERTRALRYTYDGAGRLTSTEQGTVASQADSDWSGFVSLAQKTAVYDGIGRKVQDTTIAGGTTRSLTQYSYDEANRLVCSAVRMNPGAFGAPPASACDQGPQGVDGPDRIASISYDAADQITKMTMGLGTAQQKDEVTREYGADGEITAEVDGKGNRSTYSYDAFDRVAGICFPTPSSGSTTSTTDCEKYSYDPNSNLTSFQQRNGVQQVINYGYDALNRLTSAGNVSSYTNSYTYDLLGRRTSASVNGQQVSYSYDPLGREISETSSLGTLSSTYDAGGNRTQLKWPDNMFVTYAYDAGGELTDVSDSTGQLLTHYAYDDLGRRVSITRGDNVSTNLVYGSNLQLSSLQHQFPDSSKNVTYSFVYNPAGGLRSAASSNNLYDWTGGAIALGYGVDSQNKYTAIGSLTPNYNARGSMTSDGVKGYRFDWSNRLSLLTDGSTYAYDGADRLAQVQPAGAGATRFLYDGSKIAGEYDGSRNLLRRYIPGIGEDETIAWYEGATAGDRRWLLTDRAGSIISGANGAGSQLFVNRYDEYGKPDSGNWGRLQYVGQPYLPEAGLYHMRARVYHPGLGRFLQPDPLKYKDGPNVYAYVHNEPLTHTDLSGLCTGSRLENSDGTCIETGGWTTDSVGTLQGMERREFLDALAVQEREAFVEAVDQSTSSIEAGLQDISNVGSIGVSLTPSSAPGAGVFIAAANYALDLPPVNVLGAIPGIGPMLRGTFVHSAFASFINGLGDPLYHTEVSYLKGALVTYGTSGSVRADGVYGSLSSPIYIVELKTGGASISTGELVNYYRNLPPGTQVFQLTEAR